MSPALIFLAAIVSTSLGALGGIFLGYVWGYVDGFNRKSKATGESA